MLPRRERVVELGQFRRLGIGVQREVFSAEIVRQDLRLAQGGDRLVPFERHPAVDLRADVGGGRRAGVDLALDAVQRGCQDSGDYEIGIGVGAGDAVLDAAVSPGPLGTRKATERLLGAQVAFTGTNMLARSAGSW